jgi:uncharacterized damage-inducible protein DinB
MTATSLNLAQPVVVGCIQACQRSIDMIDALTDAQFAQPVGRHSSIGAHLRHCIEHFQRFASGMQAANGEKPVISYDSRQRDRELETNRQAARRAIEVLLHFLHSDALTHPAGEVLVELIPARGADMVRLNSTIERELVFVSSHAIHHLALMEVLAELQGIDLPADTGLAYSTDAHRAKMGSNS